MAAQLVEALRHKTEDYGFDFLWVPWKFLSDLIIPFAFCIRGVQSDTDIKEYQGNSLAVKYGARVGLTTLQSWFC